MRAFKAKDLGLFSKIANKMDIKSEIDGLFVDITGKTKQELAQINQEMGIKLIMLIVENYWKAEKEVYTLLANLTDTTVKEVEDLPLDEFVKLITQVTKDESFDSFFKLVTQ